MEENPTHPEAQETPEAAQACAQSEAAPNASPCPAPRCQCGRWSWAIVVLLALAVGAFDIGTARSYHNTQHPALSLPADAAVYLEVADIWRSPALAHLLNTPAMRFLATMNDRDNSVADAIASVRALGELKFKRPGTRAVNAVAGLSPSAYLGGRVALAVYRYGPDELVWAATLTELMPLRLAGIERALSALPQGSKWKAAKAGSVTNPVTIYEIELPGGRNLSLCEAKERLVVSNSRELLAEWATDRTKNLMSSAGLKDLAGPEYDPQVRLMVWPTQFTEHVLPGLEHSDGLGRGWRYFNKVFNKFAFEAFSYEWVEATLNLVERNGKIGLDCELNAPLNKEKSRTGAIEPAMIREPELASLMPPDSFFAFSWEKNIPRLWEDILASQTEEELANILADPTSKVFSEQMFPAMALIHGIALVPQELPAEVAHEFPFPSLVLFFGLKDEEEFSQIVYDAVDNFMDDLRKEHKDSSTPIPFLDRRVNHRGVEINYFEITDNKVKGAIVPAYAFVKNTWVISTSIDGLKKVVDAVEDGRSLLSAPEFEVRRLNRLTPASGWVFVEPKGLAMEFNTNATVWNENLVKIGPTDTPLDELRYRPDEQAKYQNALRVEQMARKKVLDTMASGLYNSGPSMAFYSESENALRWEIHLGLEGFE